MAEIISLRFRTTRRTPFKNSSVVGHLESDYQGVYGLEDLFDTVDAECIRRGMEEELERQLIERGRPNV